jgi:hypothetical protein
MRVFAGSRIGQCCASTDHGDGKRRVASLGPLLLSLAYLKTRADAELASADKALAAAKTDQAKARNLKSDQ